MDLVKMIYDSIKVKEYEQRRDYLGASIIGRQCSRSIWYEYHGENSKAPSPTLTTIFEVGRRLEGLLIDYVEMTGIKVERPLHSNDYLFCQDKEIPELQGHMDAILHLNPGQKAVLEIKTTNAASFIKFKTKGLKHWDNTYYAQLITYMGMSNIDQGVLLAMNKDTSELHHEWITFDQTMYNELKTKALVIVSSNEEPPKINSSPLYYLCNRCKFIKLCHYNKENSHV